MVMSNASIECPILTITNLSGFLHAKFSHDISGAVGSVYSLATHLQETQEKEGFHEHLPEAIDVIKESAELLFHRLRIFRVAFGYLEKDVRHVNPRECREQVENYLRQFDIQLSWNDINGEKTHIGYDYQTIQIVYNLIIFLVTAVPKRSTMTIEHNWDTDTKGRNQITISGHSSSLNATSTFIKTMTCNCNLQNINLSTANALACLISLIANNANIDIFLHKN